ncbi:MAG: extracellular solute-binding protein [Candidatus Gastranaerophilales bacterium]|nr:extracellular solute-binding protein [Candidatus Gastranaerophilales bacterium]
MKKGKADKAILSVGFVIMLTVLLCACGDGAESRTEESLSTNLNIGSTSQMGPDDIPNSANASLAKENVFRVNEVELPELEDGCRASVECTAYWDDRIYAVMRITEWESDSKSYCVLSMDESGNIFQTDFLEMPEHDAARYSDFVIGADGRTYAMCQYESSSANDFTGQSASERHQYVCCWQTDGKLLWQSEVCTDSGEDLSVWSIFLTADGSLELIMTGEDAYRLSVENDGSLSESDKEKLSGETFKVLENCRRLIRKTDGSCLLLCPEREGGLNLVKYEVETDTLGEVCKLPDDLLMTSLSSTVFSAGVESDLIYAGKAGVFVYNMGDEKSSLKMDYINSDRNLTDIYSLLELDETHFFLFYHEDYTRELKAGVFEYVRPEEIPDKAVVILAGLAVNAGIKSRVIQYNRESSQYRVVVKEYASGEMLNLDIVSGHMPDILMVESLPNGESIPVESYMKKGLIADIGALIEKDEELSGQEFMDNVFAAYSVDGKLMYVVPSFQLSTIAAKTSLVGDGNDWSMERMAEVFGGMPPNVQLLDGLDRSTFLNMFMRYRGNDFIDRETGKCTFDSQEFIDIMEFAYTLPEIGSFAGESEEAYMLQYLEDRTLLLELYVWSFSQEVDERLFFMLNGYLGGDYVFVGFPGALAESTGNGQGAILWGENVMALSAVSENGDGAWDFAKYYLTEEYQKNLESSLPVRRDLFEEWAKEETVRSYYIAESGERVEYDLSLYQNGEEIVVPPLDQGQLEELIAYVESVTTIPFEDKNVMNIINEEMGAYFAGQKEAEVTAKLIQNRVQLYLSEQ